MNLQRDVPLAPLTTLGIGGPARYFARAESPAEVEAIVAWAEEHGEPLLVLAGGSNVLIADEGFAGVVLHVDLRGVHPESQDAGAVVVNVAAGERWDDFVAMAAGKGWAGIECLSGIPGSAGATPIQNVGAYGQDVSETIVRVDVYDRVEHRRKSLTNEECGFAYRSSAFKHAGRDRYVVLSVSFRLVPGGTPAVRYPDLQRELGDGAGDLRRVRDAVIAVRRRKGMVLDPSDPDTRSDGSFFTNPVLSPADWAKFPVRDAPHFPAADSVKLSAAWLIEHAGFHKGFRHGNAGISSKHTLAIVNRGGATAREVIELVRMIQRGVRERFGIELQPEPNFIGFGPRPDR